MRGKLLIRVFVVLALLSVLLYFLWRQPSPEATGGANISLSFNICLPATGGTIVIDRDNPFKVAYLRNAWIDSSRQFYAKTILLAEKDTLYVSVWNQVSLREGKRIVESYAAAPAASSEGETGAGIPYHQFFVPDAPLYFARYLLWDRRFNTLVLVDRYGPDSSAVRRFYESGSLLSKIQPCL